MDYVAIQPGQRDWLTTLTNNEQGFANKLQLCNWVKCPLINGASQYANLSDGSKADFNGVFVRWSEELLEITGDVVLPNKTTEYDFAEVPADLNGVLSGPYAGHWEDVWVASGQGSVTYQIALQTGTGNNKLHFYRTFNGSEDTASTVAHIQRTWFKHLQ